MINNKTNNGGIYRAYILSNGIDTKLYIPCLHNNIECPINTNDYTLNLEIFEKNKNCYSTPLWCIPNLQAKQHTEVHPCWVVFENGNVNHPIIMGFLGKGIKYSTNGGTVITNQSMLDMKYITDNTSGKAEVDYIFNMLYHAGASIGSACAVLGNLHVETGGTFDPTRDNGNHRGLAQWDYVSPHTDKTTNGKDDTRWGSLMAWCDENNYTNKYDTIEAQTAYLLYDLQTEGTWMEKTNNQGWIKICDKNIDTEDEVKDLTNYIREHYERCEEQGAQDRRDKAIYYWNIYKDGVLTTYMKFGVNTYSSAVDGNTKLSEHFKVDDFKCKDGSDTILISSDLITLLEQIRNYFNAPVTITSGYRTESYNATIENAAPNSKHCLGLAADIVVEGVSPSDVYEYADGILVNTGGVGKYADFTHVDVRKEYARW